MQGQSTAQTALRTSARQFTSLAVVGLLGIVGAVLIYGAFDRGEKDRAEAFFKNEVEERAHTVRAGLEDCAHDLQALVGLVVASEQVVPHEWVAYWSAVLDERQAIFGLGWIPFAAATEGSPGGIAILRHNRQGPWRPSAESSRYVLQEITPEAALVALPDVCASLGELRGRCPQTGVVVSPVIEDLLGTGLYGIVLMCRLDSVEAEETAGWLWLAMSPAGVIGESLRGLPSGPLQLTVLGLNSVPPETLYVLTPGHERLDAAGAISAGLVATEYFDFAGRTYGAEFVATAALMLDFDSWNPEVSCAAALILTALLLVFLYGRIRREAQIVDLVSLRTRQLERSNQELSVFAYAASHDLKAPLRGIANLTRFISEDLGEASTPVVQRNLERLRGRVTRMQHMLDDLLAYARVDNRDSLPEWVDTKALVEELVILLALPEGFQVAVDPDMPTIFCRRAPLELILRNLLTNAVKHHDKASGTIAVRVQSRVPLEETPTQSLARPDHTPVPGRPISPLPTGLGRHSTPAPTPSGVRGARRQQLHRYIFCVEDDGPGISAHMRDKVFHLFCTLRPRDQVEGSGMGLALVRRAVELRDGRVWIEDARQGRGAAFLFTWYEELSLA